jgi:hypothetical protein
MIIYIKVSALICRKPQQDKEEDTSSEDPGSPPSALAVPLVQPLGVGVRHHHSASSFLIEDILFQRPRVRYKLSMLSEIQMPGGKFKVVRLGDCWFYVLITVGSDLWIMLEMWHLATFDHRPLTSDLVRGQWFDIPVHI